MSKNTKEYYEEYAAGAFNNICDALDQIHLGKITILTGDNGTGKSLIRKVLASNLAKENGGEIVQLAHSSMDQRTGQHPHLSAMSVMMNDNPWSATSTNSYRFIKALLESSPNRYIVIDEPEVGMSQSLQASVAEWLNKTLGETKNNYLGVLVITHSKEIVKRLTTAEVFVNIQKKTKEEWLNSEPELMDLEDFEEKTLALFRVLRDKLTPVNK